MDLVEDKHNSDFNITKYSCGKLVINKMSYSKPIVFYNSAISVFDISNPKSISYEDIKGYASSIDLILIGTGSSALILNEVFIKRMFDENKGLEFMNTESACKTHNLLLSENRSFVSILYP